MDGVVWDQHDEWLRAERVADECEVDVDEVVCEFLYSDHPWPAELHTRLLRTCDRLVDFPRDTVIADFVDDVLGHIAFLLSSHGKYTGLAATQIRDILAYPAFRCFVLRCARAGWYRVWWVIDEVIFFGRQHGPVFQRVLRVYDRMAARNRPTTQSISKSASESLVLPSESSVRSTGAGGGRGGRVVRAGPEGGGGASTDAGTGAVLPLGPAS